MVYLFYRLRNPAAAVTILSLTLTLLQQVLRMDSYYFPAAVCAGCITLPLQCLLLKTAGFRPWTFANCIFTLDGLLIMTSFSGGWQFYAGMFMFATGALSNIFLMPSVLITGWFKKSHIKYTGAVWTISLGLAIPLGIIWQEFFNYSLWFAAVPALMALGFLMESPPMSYKHRQNPLTDNRPASLIKPFIFILTIAASLTMSVAFLFSQSIEMEVISDQQSIFFVILFVVTPFISSSILNVRGVFYQSILLIFSCETALLFMIDADVGSSLFVSITLLVYASSSLPVLVPALSHRLYGHTNCTENYTLLYAAIPAGMVTAMPVVRQIYNGEADIYTLALTLLLLLAVGLGCFFSAWKHRFVILQSPVS